MKMNPLIQIRKKVKKMKEIVEVMKEAKMRMKIIAVDRVLAQGQDLDQEMKKNKYYLNIKYFLLFIFNLN